MHTIQMITSTTDSINTIYECLFNVSKAIASPIAMVSIKGSINLANRLIETGKVDEELVLIQLITEANRISEDIYRESEGNECYTPADLDFDDFMNALEGKHFRIGNFICSFVPDQTNMNTAPYDLALKIEQNGSYAIVYPEYYDFTANPPKIIQDGKLIAGRYKFNENAEQL